MHLRIFAIVPSRYRLFESSHRHHWTVVPSRHHYRITHWFFDLNRDRVNYVALFGFHRSHTGPLFSLSITLNRLFWNVRGTDQLTGIPTGILYENEKHKKYIAHMLELGLIYIQSAVQIVWNLLVYTCEGARQFWLTLNQRDAFQNFIAGVCLDALRPPAKSSNTMNKTRKCAYLGFSHMTI